jgi:hypothetical protein
MILEGLRQPEGYGNNQEQEKHHNLPVYRHEAYTLKQGTNVRNTPFFQYVET